MTYIKENIDKINEIKNEAAIKRGVKIEDIILIAVSKTYEAKLINEAIDAGILNIGENKVQEILEKYNSVKPVKWHMIGHLQTNKVKYIIDKVSMIHSVDTLKLANEISLRAAKLGITMDILIQVNPAMEKSKFGISLDEAEQLYDDIKLTCKSVNICGLMSVVPYEDDPENVRKYFKQVREIFDIIKNKDKSNKNFQYLSMGMSHDFAVAIEEGANMIRVGTGIFGTRDYSIK